MAKTEAGIAQFWPDEHSLMHAPAMIIPIDSLASQLADSGFMHNWIAGQVRQALLDGAVFTRTKRPGIGWRGREDGVVAEYRLASEQDTKDFSITTTSSGEVKVKRNRNMYQEPEEVEAVKPEPTAREMAIAVLKAMPRGESLSSKTIAQATDLDRDVVKALLVKLRAAGTVQLEEGKWVRPLK